MFKSIEFRSIRLEMSVDQELESISAGCNSILPANYSHGGYNFTELLENELFSDMIVSIKNQNIHAHRAILAAASPLWMEQFQVNKNNIEPQYVLFNNVDPNIFRKALRFIYTGKIDDIESSAKAILLLASEEKIQPLANICEATICRSINKTNVVDVLAFAEEHKFKALEEQASHFIVAHAPEVVDTSAFKLMEKSRACFKIIRGLAQRSKK